MAAVSSLSLSPSQQLAHDLSNFTLHGVGSPLPPPPLCLLSSPHAPPSSPPPPSSLGASSPAFRATPSTSFRTLLKQTISHPSSHLPANTSLAKPLLTRNHDWLLIGTNSSPASSQGLMLLDLGTLTNVRSRASPILQLQLFSKPEEYVHDADFMVGQAIAICGLGNGMLRPVRIDYSEAKGEGKEKKFEMLEDIPTFTECVRGVACSPNSSWFVTCGDQRFTLFDLERPLSSATALMTTACPDSEYSSVVWPTFQPWCPSAIKEAGFFGIWDVRLPKTKPDLMGVFDLRGRKVYAHQRLNDHQAILGTDLGSLIPIDLRRLTRPIIDAVDEPIVPDTNVAAISSLAMDASHSKLLVAGLGLSTWNILDGTLVPEAHLSIKKKPRGAAILTHDFHVVHGVPLQYEETATYSACFGSDGSVIWSNSETAVGLAY